jgi:ankyrin repeat protein
MVYDLPPIPQPSEIVAFLIRAMSHVDDANDAALKKELQRLRKGKPLSAEAANELLRKHLRDFHDANGNDKWEATDFLPMLRGYTELCLHLDCSALPAEVVRGVFDRVAFGCFQDIFRNVLPVTGVSPEELLGNPGQATQLLWQSRVKDFGLVRLATEIEINLGPSISGGDLEKNIRRWSKGENDIQIRMILELMKNWDRKFARALLVARLYKRYCDLSLVDCRNHKPGYEIPFGFHEIQSAIAAQLDVPALREGCDLNEVQQSAINEITRLTDPRRDKAEGEAATVEALFESLESSLHGQPRLAGLGFFRGRYFAQLGRLEDALNAFGDAANWFQFRSADQLKSCLHYILNISQMLGKRRFYAKWEGLCEGLGLALDMPDAELAVKGDFPNLFPEAVPIFKSHPLGDYFIDLSKWKSLQVDLRNPDRIIKGYGKTPTPQIALFAHLGQVDKVTQLLAAGADPNNLDKNGGSPLLMSLQENNDACFWALLPVTSEEVINGRTKGGKSSLFEAISKGRVDFVQALLDRGADVEIRGEKQQTALFEAVGHFASPSAFAQAVMQAGTVAADFPAFLRKTTSPFAAEEARAQSLSQYTEDESVILPGIAEHLLQGDNPTTRQIVQCLLDAGADINAVTDNEKLTPFLYAAEVGNPWLLKILVDHGADIRSRDARGGTALSRLHFFGHSHISAAFISWVEPSDRLWLREAQLF